MQEVKNSHYKGDLILKLIEAYELNFNLGSVIKYSCRCGRKGARMDDLLKARDYLAREIALEKRRKKLNKFGGTSCTK
jgi:hypothetical protein